MAEAHADGRHAHSDEFPTCEDCHMPTPTPLRVLSLGAGVQSTCVALMSAFGEIPKFDVCIFADTGWEPAEVYGHLAKLEAELAKYDIPVRRVTAGNIREDHIRPTGEHLFIRTPRKHPEFLGKQRSFMPMFIQTRAGSEMYRGDTEEAEPAVQNGRTRRTCTKTYKIEPVEKELRVLLGLQPRQRWPQHHTVIQTFGISWDEAQRMSDPSRPCITHDYPLIDKRMTRDDCHEWMAQHGWTAPRSACIGCPFHRNDEWRRLRDEHPDEWAEAIEFDEVFRQRQRDGLLAMQGLPFLHDSRVPLAEANIDEGVGGVEVGEDCTGFCGT